MCLTKHLPDCLFLLDSYTSNPGERNRKSSRSLCTLPTRHALQALSARRLLRQADYYDVLRLAAGLSLPPAWNRDTCAGVRGMRSYRCCDAFPPAVSRYFSMQHPTPATPPCPSPQSSSKHAEMPLPAPPPRWCPPTCPLQLSRPRWEAEAQGQGEVARGRVRGWARTSTAGRRERRPRLRPPSVCSSIACRRRQGQRHRQCTAHAERFERRRAEP